MLASLLPFQAVAEEMMYRGYVMQTVSSWFRLTAVGVIVQTLVFASVHPYNTIGIISIALSGMMYALVCVFSKGIEASSAMHMSNNMAGIFMVGFGYGQQTSNTTVSGVLFYQILHLLFFLFILCADRKLHWFDEVKRDDVALFNSRKTGKNS